MIRRLRTFVSYLAGKRSEVTDMSATDALMAKVILDIHRKRTHKEIVAAPLFSLFPIHPLDRENSMKATAERAEALEDARAELLAAGTLTRAILDQHIPSVSGIKAVENVQTSSEETSAEPSYLTFEGNGRLGAMQQVFGQNDQLLIEVELYRFRNPAKIARRLNRLRRAHGLV